jgi:DNA-binding winged helix-turn-helix (wHTH) protein/tetratricopeptide (TPR) repeat protein
MLKTTEGDMPREIQLAREPDIRVGEAWLRPASRLLEYNGLREPLEPRVAQLLVALARKHGAVLGREELVDLCWGGRIVGEDAVNRCVAKARRAIAGAGLEIETVPKVGYRLADPEPNAPKRNWRRIFALAALGALGTFGTAALLVSSGTRQPTPTARPTVAVADFLAPGQPRLGGQADQIGGQVIDALVNIGLPARRLDSDRAQTADYVIRGQLNEQPDTVRALVQIAETHTGITVLSQEVEIDRDERPMVADKIAAAAAGALSATGALLALAPRTQSPTEGAQALKAATRISSGNYLGAYAIARQLMEERPGSSVAPFLFAWTSVYAVPQLPLDQRPSALREARAAASQAIRLLPRYGDARIPQCRLYPLDYARCERIYREAIATDASAATVPTLLSLQLMNAGRLSDALPLNDKSLTSDPFNPTKVHHRLYLAELMGLAGEEQLAWAYGQRYWPRLRFARQRFVGLMAAGRWREAEAMLPVVARVEPDSTATLKSIFAALHSPGEPNMAVAVRSCSPDLEPAAFIACLTGLSMAGAPEAALELASRQFPAIHAASPAKAEAQFIRDGSDPGPLFLLWGAGAKAVRQQPGFAAFAERTGLLGYWRSNGRPDFCKREKAPVCTLI